MVFYFTGTGNSLYVTKQLDLEQASILQAIHYEELTFESETIGVVCPVYGHEMPDMVKEFCTSFSKFLGSSTSDIDFKSGAYISACNLPRSSSINNLAVGYGDYVISAYGVAGKLISMVFMITVGYVSGYMPFAGYNFGAGKMKRMLSALRFTIISGTCINSLVFECKVADDTITFNETNPAFDGEGNEIEGKTSTTTPVYKKG